MQKYNLNNNFSYKEIVFFSILYLSLITGFFLSENSTGGAITDYYNQKNISIHFSNNFLDSLLNYDKYSSRHSPVLIIFLSFLEKINLDDNFIRLLHLHICLILPYIFYKIIREQDYTKNKKIALVLSSILFLSPTFRSLSIWPDSRLLGLTIFSLSIFFFVKFLNKRSFKFVIFNVISCALASYISPNFSVFSIFFLINFILYYGFKNKKILIIIILNILISLPAIYYIFILDVNFINKSAAIGGIKNENIIFINLFNNVLITFTLIFFYLIPFIISKIISIEKILNYKNILASFLIFIILAVNFDYQYNLSGGGIFFKISNYLFDNNYFFFIFSLISIIYILPILIRNKLNLLIFLLIIINNPQYTMYHKYFDPFLIISFFSIFILKKNLDLILSLKNLFYIYSFFLSFLILSVYK
ncbi:hypothetical protein [Candidatus Pelagibacter communis]|uniref:hypothetical protein n=1 Tax=Pelagibacter ubique TaxID=198252 RepID=UPI003EDFA06A